jgi:hypothetical protein
VRGVGGVRARGKVLHKQRYSQKAYFSSGKVFNSHESRGNHQEVKVKFRAASWIVQTEDQVVEVGSTMGIGQILLYEEWTHSSATDCKERAVLQVLVPLHR